MSKSQKRLLRMWLDFGRLFIQMPCLQSLDGWTEDVCDACEHGKYGSCQVLDMWSRLMESTRREIEEVPF